MSVNSYCVSVIIDLNLTRDLELNIYEIVFSLSTADHKQELLVSKEMTNITFEAQNTHRVWQVFTEQAIVVDIADEMLLNMTWLRRHDPAIS